MTPFEYVRQKKMKKEKSKMEVAISVIRVLILPKTFLSSAAQRQYSSKAVFSKLITVKMLAFRRILSLVQAYQKI